MRVSFAATKHQSCSTWKYCTNTPPWCGDYEAAGELYRSSKRLNVVECNPKYKLTWIFSLFVFVPLHRNSITSMDVLPTVVDKEHTRVMPNHQYCENLPNLVLIQNIWPLLVAHIQSMSASNLQSIDYLNVLFKLRTLNIEWKWLVDTSLEWAAFRLAKSNSKGLVMRGTSTVIAFWHALEENSNVLSLLTTPKKLTVAMWHRPLIAPFPNNSHWWLYMLKSGLEIAKDVTMEIVNQSNA